MGNLKTQVVVISASRYNMLNKDTGELIQGCTVRYCYSDNLLPHEEEDLKGYKPGKSSVEFGEFERFKEVPGVYNCELEIKIGSDGKAVASASNFDFVKSLGLAPAAAPSSPAPADAPKASK